MDVKEKIRNELNKAYQYLDLGDPLSALNVKQLPIHII